MRTLDTLRMDVKSGLRSLWRTKGLTAAAVLALALGIGANAAIFGFVDALLLHGMLPLLAGVALLACWLPARRASSIDPLVALKAE